MFDLGIQELIVIFIVALIIFGPKRLPELGRTLGKGIVELKKAMQGVREQMHDEFDVSTKTLPDTFSPSTTGPEDKGAGSGPEGAPGQTAESTKEGTHSPESAPALPADTGERKDEGT